MTAFALMQRFITGDAGLRAFLEGLHATFDFLDPRIVYLGVVMLIEALQTVGAPQ